MPGFPLAALGAGLGQWANSARQQEELRMRQQIQQLYMQKQRDDMIGQGIQALALAGGPIKPVGMPMAGGMPGAAPPQAPPSPGGTGMPIAPQAPDPQMPPAPSVGQGKLISSEAPIEVQDLPPNIGPSVTGKPGEGVSAEVPSEPVGETTIEGRQVYAPADLTPPRTEKTGYAKVEDPAPTAAPDANMKPVLQAPGGQKVDLQQFMQRVEPSELFARIKAVAPNATPQQQMNAFNGLYKIYQSDNKTEQMLLAKVLGFNVGMERIATTQRGQDLTHGDRQAGQEIQKQRVQQGNTRIQQAQQRIDAAKALRDPGAKRQALQAEQRAILAQLNPTSMMAKQPTAEERTILQTQLNQVLNELRTISGLPALPPPIPPPAPLD